MLLNIFLLDCVLSLIFHALVYVIAKHSEQGSQGYLVFDATMAADSPQVLEGPPQEDDKETPEERHHGRGEESPPHALAIVIARHVWGEWDDHIHPGYGDRRVRVFVVVVIISHSRAAVAAAGKVAIYHS